MNEDPNADLIGHTISTSFSPDTFLVVTGSSANPNYVDCDVRNVYGDTIGKTCRPAAYVRK